MPTPNWLLYAENRLAPLRRKRTGSNMPKIGWLLYAENQVAPLRRKMTVSSRRVCRSGTPRGVDHYEAFARTLSGIAPWRAVCPDGTKEGELRARFIGLARRLLVKATDSKLPEYVNFPKLPEYVNFREVPDQPLVEAAYLSYAILATNGYLDLTRRSGSVALREGYYVTGLARRRSAGYVYGTHIPKIYADFNIKRNSIVGAMRPNGCRPWPPPPLHK